MALSPLPVDLVGHKVTQVHWPARGVQMLLTGATAEGRSVANVVLTFSAVANQYELQQFLSWKRHLERKGALTRNRVDPYPLKLPATVTCLKLSRARQASYGDAAFTDAHGKPPALGPTQQLCLFALAEKRFKDRKPFPIIFERWSLTDSRGQMLVGIEEPAARRWSSEEYQRLGTQFFEAVVIDDLAAAWNMLSRACRKRLGKAEFRRRLGDYRGCAQRFELPLEQLRAYMSVNVEDDPEIVWQCVRGLPADFPRESARAQLILCSEFLREDLGVYVIEEDGTPRLDMA